MDGTRLEQSRLGWLLCVEHFDGSPQVGHNQDMSSKPASRFWRFLTRSASGSAAREFDRVRKNTGHSPVCRTAYRGIRLPPAAPVCLLRRGYIALVHHVPLQAKPLIFLAR